MKFSLIRVAGEALAARVTLTEAERREIITNSVPFIYEPGGLGIDRQEALDGRTIKFSGACFVDREQKLLGALENFRSALRRAIKERSGNQQAIADERAGREAFPGGRFADAMRGTKSFPVHARCPFKQPSRVQAWERGYNAAHDAMLEAFNETA